MKQDGHQVHGMEELQANVAHSKTYLVRDSNGSIMNISCIGIMLLWNKLGQNTFLHEWT